MLVFKEDYRNLTTELTPSWADFAFHHMYEFLKSGMVLAPISSDNEVLFLGETSAELFARAHTNKPYSFVCFTSDPIRSSSQTVVEKATNIYVFNHEHYHAVVSNLEKVNIHLSHKVKKWKLFPKGLEAVKRTRPVLGIIEPDFNFFNWFDKTHKACETFLPSATFSGLDFDVVFFSTTGHFTGSKNLPIHMLDNSSPLGVGDLSIMPNYILSLDSNNYNPVLSMFAKTVTVVKPPILRQPATVTDIFSKSTTIADFLTEFVNQLKAAETFQGNLEGALNKASVLGDLYGTYN